MAGQNLAEYGGSPDDKFMADFGPNFWFAENPDNSLENIRSFNDLEQNGWVWIEEVEKKIKIIIWNSCYLHVISVKWLAILRKS